MTINNVNSNQSVEIIFIIPLGVEEVIYPWGIHFLKSYLDKKCNTVDIQVWDLRRNNFFSEINKRYSNLLKKLFLTLKNDQATVFFGITRNPYLFLGVVACMGDKILQLINPKKSGLYSSDIKSLQREVNNYLTERINEYTRTGNNINRIWAFSVYDSTLFNSLYIAQLIRENDPNSAIIFGGDYFNFQNAPKVVHSISMIDGVVVGYGEEVLRQIVLKQQDGTPIRNLELRGLVNSSTIKCMEHSIMEINIPPFYQNLSESEMISYVQRSEDGVIRILTQRGCSWGKCIFCTQIDKKMFFPISIEHLIREIQIAIKTVNTEVVKISFDSDENNFELFLRIIEYLGRLTELDRSFDITLFLQVKSFRKELGDLLAKIDNQKIHIRFILNFESLNIETLKNMHKGHTPLQAIEAAKAIIDCGHRFITNYFSHYPLENRNSIFQETQILQRALHLFMYPKGQINLFPYGANNRDVIYQNQEKYNITVSRLPGDQWLFEAFGIDLPFSIWSYSYNDKLSLNPDHLLIATYYQSYKAWIRLSFPYYSTNLNWGKIKLSFIEIMSVFFQVLKCLSLDFLNIIIRLLKKGYVLTKRTKIFLYLGKVGRPPIGKTNALKSYFYLQDNNLIKNYNAPYDQGKWSLTLNNWQRKILQYLYWSRKYNDVVDTFKNEISESDITKFIEDQIKLGSLVQYKDFLLCTVNDPEYWESGNNEGKAS